MRGVGREVAGEGGFERALLAEQGRECAREVEGVGRLERAVLESVEPGAVAVRVEVADERVGAEPHPLAELGQFRHDRRATAPREEGCVEPDHLTVAGVVEAVRDGDGVVGDERGLLVAGDEAVEVGVEGGVGHIKKRRGDRLVAPTG